MDQRNGIPSVRWVREAAQWLRVAADPVRLHMLAALGTYGPMDSVRLRGRVPALADTTFYHHLSALKRAGFVAIDRDGTTKVYRLADPSIGAFVGQLLGDERKRTRARTIRAAARSTVG